MATKLFLRRGQHSQMPSGSTTDHSTALTQNGAVGTNPQNILHRSQYGSNAGAVNSSFVTSEADTAAHLNYLSMFVSSRLKAGALGSGTWNIALFLNEANTNANSFLNLSIYVWNPSGGSVRGFIYDSTTNVGLEWSASGAGLTASVTGSSVTASSGDLLIVEVWRHTAGQAKSTGYLQSVSYDGIAAASGDATNLGSYVESPTDNIFLNEVTVLLNGDVAGVSSTTATVVATIPPTVADGDLVLAVVDIGSNTVDVTAPAGWNLLSDNNGGANFTGRYKVYWKFALSEPASYNFTASPTGSACKVLVFIYPSGAVDATAFGSGTGTGTVVAPAVTASAANERILIVTKSIAISALPTSPAGVIGLGKTGPGVFETVLSASGSTGTFTFTIPSGGYIAQTIAIKVADKKTATPDVLALATSTFAPTVTTGGGSVTATPGVASLTTTRFAPVKGDGVVPGVKALTTATFAPQTNLAIIPGVAALATATFAPQIGPIYPGLAALTTTTFAPQANLVVTAGLATLTTTLLAPVTGGGVVVGKASLTTTTFAPQANLQVIPGVASLATNTFAPQANLVVTAGVATLTTNRFAPVTGGGVVVGTASLTTATFAPQIQLVVPVGVAALTLTTFAPIDQSGIVVATATLTTATFAPDIVNPAGAVVPTASLSTATFASVLDSGIFVQTASLIVLKFPPQIQQTVTPGVAALATATFAPALALTVTVANATVATATFAPTIVNPAGATVDTATLTTTTYAPTLGATTSAIPDTAALATNTFAPTVSATANVTVTPDAPALVVLKFAPVLAEVVPVGAATLTTARFAPDVATPRLVTVGNAALSTTAYAPAAVQGVHATPAVAALATARFAPTVTATAHVLATPATRSLALAAKTVLVRLNTVLEVSAAGLLLTGYAPTLPQRLVPDRAALTLTRFAPDVFAENNILAVVGTATLVLTAHRPGPHILFRNATAVVVREAPAISAFAQAAESGAVVVREAPARGTLLDPQDDAIATVTRRVT